MSQKQTKIIRLHNLVQLLSTKRHYLTAKVLADQLYITERTVFRDIEYLRQMGYGVVYDRGYKILNPPKSLKIPVSNQDLKTLQTLIQSSPLLRLPNMEERCHYLLQKLSMHVEETIPSTEPAAIETKTERNPNYKISMNRLEKAINELLVIKILYQSLEESQPRERVIHPYALTIREGEWYLIAYTPARNDYRSYRLERIHSMTLTKDKFPRDPQFDLEALFEHSFGIFRGDEIHVVVRLHGKAARLASERIWHEDTGLTWENETTAILRTTVQGTTEILKWVLSMGREAEVLEPKPLRNEIRSEIKKMLDSYK